MSKRIKNARLLGRLEQKAKAVKDFKRDGWIALRVLGGEASLLQILFIEQEMVNQVENTKADLITRGPSASIVDISSNSSSKCCTRTAERSPSKRKSFS